MVSKMETMVSEPMKLQSPHFEDIEKGSKIYEVRLADAKRLSISIGDTITFVHTETKKSITKVVKDIDRYLTFAAVLQDKGVQNVLPGRSSIEDGVENVYYKINGYKEREKDGIICF